MDLNARQKLMNMNICYKCGKNWGFGLRAIINTYIHNPNGIECKSIFQCSIRIDERKNVNKLLSS